MKRLVFDPVTPYVNESRFNNESDWKDFYGDIKEEDPHAMPEPLGKAVKTFCIVDANHAGNVVTRHSHSGVLIFIMNALIISYSKRQNTVESASYGSKLVVMRIARDLVVALRIKLKSFGVPLDGPTDTFTDNEAVYKNVTFPESALTKKHNSINYHM